MTDPSNRQEEITIVDYKRKYARYFRDINRAWIEEYFELEQYDLIMINDPESQIIAHGGCVLFAVLDGDVVGTCALLRHAERKYELAKMGVLKQYHNRGVGKKLAKAAIQKARALGADILVLATSRKLKAANHLYRSLGFCEVDLAEVGPLPYRRESIAMRLSLNASDK